MLVDAEPPIGRSRRIACGRIRRFRAEKSSGEVAIVGGFYYLYAKYQTIRIIMANLRELKKEIDYRLEEVVFDCDMAIAFQPSPFATS